MQCQLARVLTRKKDCYIWVAAMPPETLFVFDIFRGSKSAGLRVTYRTPYIYQGHTLTVLAKNVELLPYFLEIATTLSYEEWERKGGESIGLGMGE